MDSAAQSGSFQEQLSSSLVQITRSVNQLATEDLNFHRSSSAEASNSIDEQSGRLLSLTSSLLKAATSGTDFPAPALKDEDSVEDDWRSVVDAIDGLLERSDACLDEFTGIIKKLSPSQEQAANVQKKTSSRFPTIYDLGRSRIPKPQLKFARRPDNTDVSPFKPLLRSKPHYLVSLSDSLKSADTNPYEHEIKAAQYPPSTYEVSPPIDFHPFDSTTATFVHTMKGVKDMLKELKGAKEIAIDLEHHDVHSYHGLVSLMQISTRDKDWVVDTLKPWREDLQILNIVFANPSILKVFHGSAMDIIWLQRDLGLYVVGLFDTYHAACALEYPKRGLKFLLQKFANFEADKKYQVADWRVRPLPSGMFDYARSDTHYLLHVFDHLRNELVQASTPDNNLVDYVLKKSKDEALQVYRRPVYDAVTGNGGGGWRDYLTRGSSALSKEQFAVFKAVHQWRDQVARAEDEGVQCVFPKHILFKVANVMPLDKGTLFKTLSPVTPLAKSRASELLEVIKNAKAAGAAGPELRDFIKTPNPASPVDAADAVITPRVQETDYPTTSPGEVSQLWGTALDTRQSPVPPEFSAVASAEALRLSLPLPLMPKTVSEAQEKLAVSKPAPPQPAAPAPAEEDQNKIFSVKELGGPRKRKATPVETGDQEPADEAGDPNADTIPVEPVEKLTKRQRRKLKRSKSDSQTPAEKAAEGTTPFNYEAADSVLHAQRPERAGAAQPKRFNPYAKAMDAPSGAKKGKTPSSGKAFTFR